MKLAPFFDHGLSLVFSCYDNEDAVRDFDVMKDYPVNNYFFAKSTFLLAVINSCKLIRKTLLPNKQKSKMMFYTCCISILKESIFLYYHHPHLIQSASHLFQLSYLSHLSFISATTKS